MKDKNPFVIAAMFLIFSVTILGFVMWRTHTRTPVMAPSAITAIKELGARVTVCSSDGWARGIRMTEKEFASDRSGLNCWQNGRAWESQQTPKTFGAPETLNVPWPPRGDFYIDVYASACPGCPEAVPTAEILRP